MYFEKSEFQLEKKLKFHSSFLYYDEIGVIWLWISLKYKRFSLRNFWVYKNSGIYFWKFQGNFKFIVNGSSWQILQQNRTEWFVLNSFSTFSCLLAWRN